MLSHEQAAHAMGMAVPEIIAVAEVGDCHVVTTHDGIHTLVTPTGQTEPYDGPDPAAAAAPSTSDDTAGDPGTGTPVDQTPADQSPVGPTGASPTPDGGAGGQVPVTIPPGGAGTLDGEPPAPGLAVDVDGDGVPDGTAEQIMAWVNGDPARAAAALSAEHAKDKPRAGLSGALEKLATP